MREAPLLSLPLLFALPLPVSNLSVLLYADVYICMHFPPPPLPFIFSSQPLPPPRVHHHATRPGQATSRRFSPLGAAREMGCGALMWRIDSIDRRQHRSHQPLDPRQGLGNLTIACKRLYRHSRTARPSHWLATVLLWRIPGLAFVSTGPGVGQRDRCSLSTCDIPMLTPPTVTCRHSLPSARLVWLVDNEKYIRDGGGWVCAISRRAVESLFTVSAMGSKKETFCSRLSNRTVDALPLC